MVWIINKFNSVVCRTSVLTSNRLDSTPFDTLRNLGFAPGESMAEDFLELCENADPINHTPVASGDQDEDEEAVWRRLVMRGRFI